jgi:hypothetical protein
MQERGLLVHEDYQEQPKDFWRTLLGPYAEEIIAVMKAKNDARRKLQVCGIRQ